MKNLKLYESNSEKKTTEFDGSEKIVYTQFTFSAKVLV